MTDLYSELDAFLKHYESATNSHDFENVRPLISSDAIYFFSNENLYGINEIEKAFISTFNTILEETYTLTNVKWIAVTDSVAACVYDFHWIGKVEGKEKSGQGRGTNVLVKKDGKWSMAHEHLSAPRGQE